MNEDRVPPELSPEGIDARLLGLAREGKTIDEVGLALRSTDFHLYQRLYALHRQGAVEVAEVVYADPAQGGEPSSPTDDGLRHLRALLLEPPRTPRLKVKPHDISLMRLSAMEKYLLSRCDGSRDLRQIVQGSPLLEREVLVTLKVFLDGRIVELA